MPIPDPLKIGRRLALALRLAVALVPAYLPAQTVLEYPGGTGPGAGKRIVLIAGEEEYRSEETLPMVAKILAGRFGFHCTLLFSQNAAGAIDPDAVENIPGLAAVGDADLLVLSIRFRELPDAGMKHIIDYLDAGKPVIGIRTATHSFNYVKRRASPYAKWSFQSASPQGGFGRAVLGQTWVSHWGIHGSQSTRGLVRAAAKDLPILRGVQDVWGPSDVYEAAPLAPDAQVLLDGQVLSGMKPGDAPLAGKATMPICWTRAVPAANGKIARVFTTTIGAATDFQSEDLRRLFVNACFWTLGMEAAIPSRADVGYMTPYAPSNFGFGGFRKGVKPSDLAWTPPTVLLPASVPVDARTRGLGYRLDGKRLQTGKRARKASPPRP